MIKVQSVRWKDASTALKVFFVSIAIVAGILLMYLSMPEMSYHWQSVVTWAILLVVAGLFPVNVKSAQTMVSMEVVIIFALTLLFGPSVTVWMILLGVIVQDGIFGRRSIFTTALNMAQGALAAGASGFLYALSGGAMMLSHSPQRFSMNLYMIIPLLLYAVIFLLINLGTVSFVTQLSTGRAWQSVWRHHFKWLIFTYIAAITPLALLMVYVQVRIGTWAVCLCFLPLLFIQISTKMYFKDKQVMQDQAEVGLNG